MSTDNNRHVRNHSQLLALPQTTVMYKRAPSEIRTSQTHLNSIINSNRMKMPMAYVN